MDRVIIVRYNELGLKGNNRPVFERQLERNIVALASRHGVSAVPHRKYGRLLVETLMDPSCFKRVFGIASVSRAQRVASLDAAKDVLKGMLPSGSQTFRISCQRLDKSFPIESRKVAAELGAFVVEHSGAKVKLVGPDVDIGVEIIDGFVYVCEPRVACFGGLPSGVEGVVLVDLDQPHAEFAGLLMAKRGCAVFPFARSSRPADLLSAFLPSVVPVTVISGETDVIALGQRVHALSMVGSAVLPGPSIGVLPVLYPLTGMSEEEIKTYEQAFTVGCCGHV